MRTETPVAITQWRCGCGLSFRAARYADGWAFWAENGHETYAQETVPSGTPCPGCGEPVGHLLARER